MRLEPASLTDVVGRERDVEVGGGMWRSSSVVASRRTRERTTPAIAEKLRGAASVAVVKTTDLRQGDNATELGLFDGARFGCVLGKRQVGTRAVVVAKVAVQLPTKMFLVEYNHVVEKLSPNRADHSLGVWVLPW